MRQLTASFLSLVGAMVIAAVVLLVSMLVFDLPPVASAGIAIAAILPLVAIGVILKRRAWAALTVQPEPSELEARLAAYRHTMRINRLTVVVGLAIAAVYCLALAAWHLTSPAQMSPARRAAFVAIVFAVGGWCMVLAYFKYWQMTFRCPKCGNAFGRRRAFDRYPHRCRSCDFMIDDAEPDGVLG